MDTGSGALPYFSRLIDLRRSGMVLSLATGCISLLQLLWGKQTFGSRTIWSNTPYLNEGGMNTVQTFPVAPSPDTAAGLSFHFLYECRRACISPTPGTPPSLPGNCVHWGSVGFEVFHGNRMKAFMASVTVSSQDGGPAGLWQ